MENATRSWAVAILCREDHEDDNEGRDAGAAADREADGGNADSDGNDTSKHAKKSGRSRKRPSEIEIKVVLVNHDRVQGTRIIRVAALLFAESASVCRRALHAISNLWPASYVLNCVLVPGWASRGRRGGGRIWYSRSEWRQQHAAHQ